MHGCIQVRVRGAMEWLADKEGASTKAKWSKRSLLEASDQYGLFKVHGLYSGQQYVYGDQYGLFKLHGLFKDRYDLFKVQRLGV